MKRTMLNNLNNRPPSILVVLLVSALVTLLSARTRQVRQEQARPLGCLTAEQVLSLSGPICQAVAARYGPFTLSAEALTGADNFWQVACSDTAGQDLLDLDWNADTGELSLVAWFHYKFLSHAGPPLNSARAIGMGHFWLRALRVSPASIDWRLLRPPVGFAREQWTLFYAAKGRFATIRLDAHTGALVCAQFSRTL